MMKKPPGKAMWRTHAAGLWAALLLLGCTPSGGGGSESCTPGKSVVCECGQGQSGFAECSDDGNLGDCTCKDDATSEDAFADVQQQEVLEDV